MKKIAVIGSGISGHVAAYRLKDHAEVTLYEAEHRFGGHANTVEATGENQKPVAIDTGFIVYNELTYPGLTKLFEDLNVVTTATDMSFGCQDERTGLQYSTKNIDGMFAQRKNSDYNGFGGGYCSIITTFALATFLFVYNPISLLIVPENK